MSTQANAALEEDEVIREIDVYVTNAKFPLYLAQFPLKPVYADPVNVKAAKYKAKHHMVELQVPYSQEILSAFDGSMQVDNHQRFASSLVETQNALATGFISADTLYISPVSHLLQFRPQLKQSNGLTKLQSLEMTQDMDAYEEEEALAAGEKPEGNNSAQPQQAVQLKRKESEKAQNARLQSYSHLKQLQEAEPWRNMKVHAIGSAVADSKFVEMAQSVEESLQSTEKE